MDGRIETGACFCGAIAAEMRGEPFWVCTDHDDDCRRAIGSPLTVWVGYRPHQVRLTRGRPKEFSKTKGIVRTFCGDCGSSIAYRDEGLSNEIYVTIGFFDHPERFSPQAHAYWRLRLPWVEFSDDLPRIDTYSRPRDPAFGNPADRK
ncbi:GFA family protein [Mesorhizobium sp. B4-1-4]|uniref:GFA family protein n=1 Tax=Mesorhizobium sp. B4-1-4 TaxID=2589888 RepID=UPI00112BF7C8|nr:GFA family protein [Mesorhizobium sp. B4-1-4]UCI34830.1 GFA family protein [Mesorhizobium sp. B4-1-4]